MKEELKLLNTRNVIVLLMALSITTLSIYNCYAERRYVERRPAEFRGNN